MTVKLRTDNHKAKREAGAYIVIDRDTDHPRFFVVVEWIPNGALGGKMRVINASTEYSSTLDGAEVDKATLVQRAPVAKNAMPKNGWRAP